MRRVGHRPASQNLCRFIAHAAVAGPAAALNRTIPACRELLARQTQVQPTPSSLRPPQTKSPNTHSDRGTATLHLPRVPSLQASGRRPRGIVREGRHPEPLTITALWSSAVEHCHADQNSIAIPQLSLCGKMNSALNAALANPNSNFSWRVCCVSIFIA